MYKDLADAGYKKEDFMIEKQEGNKKTIDNSNNIAMEQEYQNQAISDVFDEILIKYTNMNLAELMQDIGLDVFSSNEENKQFGLNITKAITGKTDNTPSKK